MNAKEWARENNVKITYGPLSNKEMQKHISDYSFIRSYFKAAVFVEDRLIISGFEFSPSPFEKSPLRSEFPYDAILNFLYFYSDWDDSTDKDEQESIDMARKFTAALSEQARREFINGWIDFEE